MSLTDALLNEGYRDPREVWIALRADGQKGSGTIDDPYDGSRRSYTPIGISTLSKAVMWATAVTPSNHGFASGDMVTINGVGTTQAGDVFYTGTFPVVVLSNNSFQYQMMYEPASVQAQGTITCVREREQFDAVMRGMPAYSMVHVGPGVFESKGTTAAIPCWEPKSGQRIQGSGWGVTTLKLVNASWPELAYTLIGQSKYYDFIEDFEASDLTFDCNIAGQPNQLVDCRAIAITGKHVLLRRLRAINFSSQTTGYVENFVFGVGAPHPDAGVGKEGVNCVMEDCVAESPGLNAANNSSVFILFSGERPTDGIMAYHRAFAIRQIWYDGTFADRPVSIASIAISAGVATVTTRTPHNRNNNDWVVIAGAVENGSLQSAYNGTYQISNVSAYQFTYTPVAYGGLPVPTTNPTGDMWVDRFSSHPVSVQQLKRNTSDSTIAELTSHGPHNRKPGQWVRVPAVNIKPGTEAYFSKTLNIANAEFGRFPIIDGSITAPNVLKYQMDHAPSVALVQDTYCLPPNTPDNSPACMWDTVFLGVRNAGFSTDGGSEAIAESNRVFNAAVGGSYHDTWGTKDQTDRNNYYSDVVTGPDQNMGSYSALKQGSLSVVGTTATFTTTDPHGLVVGQAVRIDPFLGTPPQEYFAVTSVPTLTTFTFEVSGMGTPMPPYSFGALWQVGLAIRENNVIELGQAHHATTTWGYSIGVRFLSGPHDTQYVFRSVIARGNVIRLIPSSTNSLAQGIQLLNVERAVVENNLIDLLSQAPMSVGGSKPLHFFNNQDSSGALIQPATGQIAPDLRVRIEDALTMAL